MRLQRIDLVNFRGVAERSITFGESGVTVLVGDNETGKSSLLEAFDLLLRLPAESKRNRLDEIRPVGQDVGTEVRAEFELGQGNGAADTRRLTYQKRWFRERRTELTVTEADGGTRSYTGREAHDEAARLFAEHVDTTLWEALVVAQTNTLTLPEARQMSTVLAALEHETAEDPTQSSTPLLDRIDAEYHRYFTPRSGKPTGEYAKALEASEEAQQRVRQAEQRAAEVDQDVQRAERLAEDLERLRAQQAELDQEVARLQQERDDASERLNEVQRLHGEAELANERLDHVRAEHERRTGRRHQVEQLRNTVAETRRELAESTDRLQRAEQQLTEHNTALTRARDQRSTARDRTARLDAELSGLRDRTELGSLRERIREVEHARSAERAAAAELERHPIDATAAERAEESHRRVLAARAVARAGAPTVRLRRLGEVPVTVNGAPVAYTNGNPSASGEGNEHEFVVQAGTTVLAESVLELNIHPGDGVEALRAELEAAEHAEQEVLAELGAADVDAVRAGAQARSEAEQALELARRTVQARLGEADLDELTARADALQARLDAVVAEATADTVSGEDAVDGGAETDASPNEDELRQQLEAARRHEAEAVVALSEAEEAERAVRKETEAARDAATGCRVRLEQTEEQLRTSEQTLLAARTEESDEQLDQRLADAIEHAEQVVTAHQEAAEALAASGADRIETDLTEAIRLRDEAARRVESYQGDLRQIEGRLDMAGAHGIATELERARAAEAAADRTAQVLRRRAEAASRLAHTVERHRAEAHRRYAAPLRQRIDELGRQVYGPTFGVILDENLTVVQRSLHGVQVPIPALSTGSREQLATIVRLAIAELAGVAGESVPVVLDDALGWSDPGRLRTMARLLERAGGHGQVLLLTCMPDRYGLVAGAELIRLN